jgi:hypothetical protein
MTPQDTPAVPRTATLFNRVRGEIRLVAVAKPASGGCEGCVAQRDLAMCEALPACSEFVWQREEA